MGSPSYKTWPGAVASTILLVAMYYFEIALFIDVVNNKTVALSQDKQYVNLEDAKEMNLKEMGFDMAFGFLGE